MRINFMPTGKIDSGFTLLEVLIAVAVVAVAMAAIIQTTGRGAVNANHLENATLAHWVAMNEMAELKLADEPPDTGDEEGDVEMAGRRWYWTVKTESTQDPDLRRVEIRVRQHEDDDAASLARLTGLFGLRNISKDGNKPNPTRQPGNNPSAGDTATAGSSLAPGRDRSGDDNR